MFFPHISMLPLGLNWILKNVEIEVKMQNKDAVFFFFFTSSFN